MAWWWRGQWWCWWDDAWWFWNDDIWDWVHEEPAAQTQEDEEEEVERAFKRLRVT
jgi:hypothetical protein